MGGGLASDHVVEVCEYFRFYPPAQAQAEKEDAASNRGCEPRLGPLGFHKSKLSEGLLHLQLPRVRKEGGADALSPRAQQHHGAAPHPVLAGQVHRLDFQLDRVGAGKLQHPRLFRQVQQWSSTRVLCVAVVLLHKNKVKRLIWKSGTLV